MIKEEAKNILIDLIKNLSIPDIGGPYRWAIRFKRGRYKCNFSHELTVKDYLEVIGGVEVDAYRKLLFLRLNGHEFYGREIEEIFGDLASQLYKGRISFSIPIGREILT